MYRTDKRSTGSCWRRRRSSKAVPGCRRRKRWDQWVFYSLRFQRFPPGDVLMPSDLSFFLLFAAFLTLFLVVCCTNWILLKSFPIFVSLPGFLPPQRFSVEGLSSVIQNSFRQTFGSGCSERQVIFYFCSTSSYCFLNWKYALCQECHLTETPTTEPLTLVFVSVLQYLTTVIPYEKKGHPPSLEDLQILTKSKCLHNNSTWVILAATDPLTLLYLLPCSSSSYERRQWQGAQSLDRLHSQRWAFLICLNWSLWHDVLSLYALLVMFDRSQRINDRSVFPLEGSGSTISTEHFRLVEYLQYFYFILCCFFFFLMSYSQTVSCFLFDTSSWSDRTNHMLIINLLKDTEKHHFDSRLQQSIYFFF